MKIAVLHHQEKFSLVLYVLRGGSLQLYLDSVLLIEMVISKESKKKERERYLKKSTRFILYTLINEALIFLCIESAPFLIPVFQLPIISHLNHNRIFKVTCFF